MRAVVTHSFGPPEVLRLAEVPAPAVGPDELLIRVFGSGVNPADLLQRQGLYNPPAGASELLGLEVSGVIAEVGAAVRGWRVGDPCLALLAGGGYAELVAAPAGQVVRPPGGVDLITASGLIEVAATVYSNLAAAGLQAGETLLVHGGTGGIGTFAVQYARALGAQVYATAGSPAKIALCHELGVEHAFSYHDDWPTAFARATAGRGADVILDVVGGRYLEANVSALATGGRLIVIGLKGGRKGTLDLAKLLAKRASVTATGLRGRPAAQKAAICAELVANVWSLIEDGQIKPAPETRYPISRVAEAHRQLASGSTIGKIILTWPAAVSAGPDRAAGAAEWRPAGGPGD